MADDVYGVNIDSCLLTLRVVEAKPSFSASIFRSRRLTGSSRKPIGRLDPSGRPDQLKDQAWVIFSQQLRHQRFKDDC